jgi:predicted TIM-barrel fold metal-dependent hydrolase
MQIVDACAHPLLTSTAALREYLPRPWNTRTVPEFEHNEYASSRAGLVPDAVEGKGSDPALAATELLDRRGIADVILVPPTRNLHPNTDLVSAICTATNQWLADEWLPQSDHFWGSIRINPLDPATAVREIDRWAGHSRFVQIAVPTQSQHPYGQRMFFPIWEAAARHGLPVALHSDGAAGADFAPTIVGYLSSAIEYAALQPLNAVYHLASLIAEGVLERLPDLRIVCAEGGLDAMTPIFWRMDKDYRGTREEIPWTKQIPTRYIRGQVRFCSQRIDRAPDGVPLERWWEVTGAADLLMYASNFPYWDVDEPALGGDDAATVERILSGNARELYRLPAPTPA